MVIRNTRITDEEHAQARRMATESQLLDLIRKASKESVQLARHHRADQRLRRMFTRKALIFSTAEAMKCKADQTRDERLVADGGF